MAFDGRWRLHHSTCLAPVSGRAGSRKVSFNRDDCWLSRYVCPARTCRREDGVYVHAYLSTGTREEVRLTREGTELVAGGKRLKRAVSGICKSVITLYARVLAARGTPAQGGR